MYTARRIQGIYQLVAMLLVAGGALPIQTLQVRWLVMQQEKAKDGKAAFVRSGSFAEI